MGCMHEEVYLLVEILPLKSAAIVFYCQIENYAYCCNIHCPCPDRVPPRLSHYDFNVFLVEHSLVIPAYRFHLQSISASWQISELHCWIVRRWAPCVIESLKLILEVDVIVVLIAYALKWHTECIVGVIKSHFPLFEWLVQRDNLIVVNFLFRVYYDIRES